MVSGEKYLIKVINSFLLSGMQKSVTRMYGKDKGGAD